MKETHILIVAFATYGHFNPALQFSNLLARLGLHVTFVTSNSVFRLLGNIPPSDRLSFASFSDGYDDGFKPGVDYYQFLSEFERRGSKAIKDIISESRDQHPFTFVVYSLLIPWVGEVARSLHLPSALLWNQAAIVFDIYYHFFHGYEEEILESSKDPSGTIQLPGLPLLLSSQDLPSHMHASNLYTFGLPLFRKHFQVLEQDTDPKILINSFDELEYDAMRAISKFNLIPIGPVLSPMSGSADIIDWLKSKPKSSVVYISFGSIVTLSKKQMEEIGRGVLDYGGPFVWVIREREDEESLSCRKELGNQGKIVSWCSQMEVLSNEGIGCFITHCGWNSSLESLRFGVPVVAFPQWVDQSTSAMVLCELSKTGVKLNVNKEGLVLRDEIRRCLELVMGDGIESQKLKRNAVKWRELAEKAVADGGSSDLNLKSFVHHVCTC